MSFRGSLNVAELWMSIAKVPNLILIQSVQTMVPLSNVTLLVLPLRVQDTSECQNQYAALACQVDSMTSRILRRLLGNVCPCGQNTTSCTKRDDIGGRNSTYGWVAGIVSRPGKEPRATGECADRDQEDASISRIRVCDPSEYSEACNGGDREDG